jgi:hypothetical protein
MAVLTAAVIFVGALGALNLLLLAGVIRRLRQHSDLIREGHSNAAGPDMLAPGDQVDEFVSSTTDGGRIGLATLHGDTMFAFLKPGCQPCEEQLPEFLALAAHHGRGHVVAVIAGSPGEELTGRLAGLARVVIETPDGPTCRAFRVTGFPSYFIVDSSGVVRASGYRPPRLATTVA